MELYESNPFFGEFAKLRKETIRFIASVCLSAWNSAPTWRNFTKFDILVLFFEKSTDKTQVH